MDNLKWKEYVQSFSRLGILIAFFAAFGYIVINFTGSAEGQIKPETIYSYLTGIISGKLVEYYLTSRPDTVAKP